MWSEATGRCYPYGLYAFWLYVIMGSFYVIVMLFIGILFLRASKILKKKRFSLLGIAFVLVGFLDSLHVIGHVLFLLLNDSRAPIKFNSYILYFYPFATSLAVSGIIIYFTLLYVYSSLEVKSHLGIVDRIVIAIGGAGIALALNPYNWWNMIPPKNAINTTPLTGLVILILGALSILSLRRYHVILTSKLVRDPISEVKLKLFLAGIILLAIAVILMMPHVFLAKMHYYDALLVVTSFKLALLTLSALCFYLGLVAPASILNRLIRKRITP
mgnify:CR=1 FL=1